MSLHNRAFATREPTVDIMSEIRIDCPIQLVSVYVADPLNMPLWRQNVWAVERLSPTTLGEGSRIGLKTRSSRRKSSIVYEVTEFVPETRLVMRAVEGSHPLETTYTWKDTPSGATHLTLRSRSEPTGLARRVLPVMTAAARRKTRNDLERLKDLLEYA